MVTSMAKVITFRSQHLPPIATEIVFNYAKFDYTPDNCLRLVIQSYMNYRTVYLRDALKHLGVVYACASGNLILNPVSNNRIKFRKDLAIKLCELLEVDFKYLCQVAKAFYMQDRKYNAILFNENGAKFANGYKANFGS